MIALENFQKYISECIPMEAPQKLILSLKIFQLLYTNEMSSVTLQSKQWVVSQETWIHPLLCH